MRSSRPSPSKRHSSTRSAFSEKSEKFVPLPSQSGPSGNGLPVQTARSDICGTVAAEAGVVRRSRDDRTVIAWFGRLMTWEDRHRRLTQRLAIVLFLTALVDAAG